MTALRPGRVITWAPGCPFHQVLSVPTASLPMSESLTQVMPAFVLRNVPRPQSNSQFAGFGGSFQTCSNTSHRISNGAVADSRKAAHTVFPLGLDHAVRL